MSVVTTGDPVAGPELDGAAIPMPFDPSDDGSTPPALQAALMSVAAGQPAGVDVLQALASSRLLVPVVAVLDDPDLLDADDQGRQREKSSSMATVVADSPLHGRALLAFSSTEAMSQWRDDARPVAVPGPLAARAALAESVDAMVVDIGGPFAFAVNGEELLLLAAVARPRGGRAEDPVLHTALVRLLPKRLAVAFALRSRAGHPTEESLELRLPSVPPYDDPWNQSELVSQIAHDRVVRQLCPEGLRVTFGDTQASGKP